MSPKLPAVFEQPRLGVLPNGAKLRDGWHSIFDRLLESPNRLRPVVAMGAAVVSTLTLAGGTASASGEKSRNQFESAKPVLTCKAGTVRRVGGMVIANGGCKIGNRPVPSKWTWTERSFDLSGSACKRYGSGKGRGKQFALPTKPKDLLGNPVGGFMPGVLEGTFKVSARYGKQTAKATGSLTIRTPDSHVLCGEPPELINVDGPQPLPLSWETLPTFDGKVIKAGTIRSEGNGKCVYVPEPTRMEAGYLVYGNSIKCPNNVGGSTAFRIFYSPDGVTVCDTRIDGPSSFPVSPKWGLGNVYLRARIDSWDANSVQFPYTDQNMWDAPAWIPARGTVNPCEAYPGWSQPYPYPSR